MCGKEKNVKKFDVELKSFKPQILILCIGDDGILEETSSDEVSAFV